MQYGSVVVVDSFSPKYPDFPCFRFRNFLLDDTRQIEDGDHHPVAFLFLMSTPFQGWHKI